MIGGYDIIYDTDVDPKKILRKTWDLVSNLWPNAVLEDGDTGVLIALPSATDAFADRDEVFIYKDLAARDSWNKLGAEPENFSTMIHVLAGPGMATLVVGDPNDPVAREVITSLADFLQTTPYNCLGKSIDARIPA